MAQDFAGATFPLTHVRVTGDIPVVRDGYVRVVEAEGHRFVRGLFTFQEWTDMHCCAGLLGGYAAFARSTPARPGRLQSGGVMLVHDAARVIVPGVLIGVPVALAAAQLERSQLYDIVPVYPKAIAGASAVFLLAVARSRSCRR